MIRQYRDTGHVVCRRSGTTGREAGIIDASGINDTLVAYLRTRAEGGVESPLRPFRYSLRSCDAASNGDRQAHHASSRFRRFALRQYNRTTSGTACRDMIESRYY